MTTEQAGISRDSAFAQQVHHAAQVSDRNARPEPAPVAAAAMLRPGFDPPWLRAVRKALGCVLRPYPVDSADPRGSKRRAAVVIAGAAGTVALLGALRRAR